MPKVSESKILAVAIFGTFMEILDQTVMNVALPHIMAVFNATTDRAQLIVSAYLMASAISTPAAAFLSDRFGIKKSVPGQPDRVPSWFCIMRLIMGLRIFNRFQNTSGLIRRPAQPAFYDIHIYECSS